MKKFSFPINNYFLSPKRLGVQEKKVLNNIIDDSPLKDLISKATPERKMLLMSIVHHSVIDENEVQRIVLELNSLPDWGVYYFLFLVEAKRLLLQNKIKVGKVLGHGVNSFILYKLGLHNINSLTNELDWNVYLHSAKFPEVMLEVSRVPEAMEVLVSSKEIPFLYRSYANQPKVFSTVLKEISTLIPSGNPVDNAKIQALEEFLKLNFFTPVSHPLIVEFLDSMPHIKQLVERNMAYPEKRISKEIITLSLEEKETNDFVIEEPRFEVFKNYLVESPNLSLYLQANLSLEKDSTIKHSPFAGEVKKLSPFLTPIQSHSLNQKINELLKDKENIQKNLIFFGSLISVSANNNLVLSLLSPTLLTNRVVPEKYAKILESSRGHLYFTEQLWQLLKIELQTEDLGLISKYVKQIQKHNFDWDLIKADSPIKQQLEAFGPYTHLLSHAIAKAYPRVCDKSA